MSATLPPPSQGKPDSREPRKDPLADTLLRPGGVVRSRRTPTLLVAIVVVFVLAGAVAKAVGNGRRHLRRGDGIGSGSEVNGGVGRLLTEALPGIVNLAGHEACSTTRQWCADVHAAIWTHVSSRQARKASARARRCRAAVIKCRRGRK